MNISILTVFPELYEQFIGTSIIKRAAEQGLITFNFIKFSSLCAPKQRIDEATAGPGIGMIIKPEVIEAAINQCEQRFGPGLKLFFSPQGTILNQQFLRRLAGQVTEPCAAHVLQDTPPGPLRMSEGMEAGTGNNSKDVLNGQPQPHLILICTRYEGIDQRLLEHYKHELISIGDYVVMGGDLPAQVFLEGFLRLLPGVVGNAYSVEDDSFSGALLDYPQYGQTQEWQGLKAPDIIKSGNHAAVAQWRIEQAAKTTTLGRWDWLRSSHPTKAELKAARHHIPNHYAALLHTEILHKDGSVGTSSVATLDIHDIARSGSTYGLTNYFIVTPLKDQTELVKVFLGFWDSKEGKEYNKTRFDAIAMVRMAASLDETVAQIEKKEGKKPLLIATCAKLTNYPDKTIDYYSQGLVWKQERPVLFLFGTAHGLAPQVLERADYLLLPIAGMADYNHLSVRSAAGIIFDRWLGLNPRKKVDII